MVSTRRLEVMLHGLEDCRILGVDDAFQSELRGGQLWKIACERLLLAGSGPCQITSVTHIKLTKHFPDSHDGALPPQTNPISPSPPPIPLPHRL